MRRVIDNSDNK